jgi:hypothetical protein
MRIWRALTRNRAYTRPDADDPRLVTRRYAVPFARVGSAAGATRGEGRWHVVTADARKGEIAAEASTRLWKFVDDVWIRVWLDEDGRTCVDVASASRVGRADLGTNARRIARFLHRLERRLSGGETVNHSTDSV